MINVNRKKTSAFLVRCLVAHLTGISEEEFVEQEMRLLRCVFCRQGLPLVDGMHKIDNLTMPCEAEQVEVQRDD